MSITTRDYMAYHKGSQQKRQWSALQLLKFLPPPPYVREKRLAWEGKIAECAMVSYLAYCSV